MKKFEKFFRASFAVTFRYLSFKVGTVFIRSWNELVTRTKDFTNPTSENGRLTLTGKGCANLHSMFWNARNLSIEVMNSRIKPCYWKASSLVRFFSLKFWDFLPESQRRVPSLIVVQFPEFQHSKRFFHPVWTFYLQLLCQPFCTFDYSNRVYRGGRRTRSRIGWRFLCIRPHFEGPRTIYK